MKEFLYIGYYEDAQGDIVLKIGTTNDLKRRRYEHNTNYRKATNHTMPKENSFEYVLSAAIKEAEKALANTIFQNPVLEKAGVVDAGGKGWLLVMQAMLHALNKDKVDYAPKAEAPAAAKSETANK